MKAMTLLLLSGIGVGLLGVSSALAAPVNGAVIGEAATASEVTQKVVWRGVGWRGVGWRGVGWRGAGWRGGWGWRPGLAAAGVATGLAVAATAPGWGYGWGGRAGVMLAGVRDGAGVGRVGALDGAEDGASVGGVRAGGSPLAGKPHLIVDRVRAGERPGASPRLLRSRSRDRRPVCGEHLVADCGRGTNHRGLSRSCSLLPLIDCAQGVSGTHESSQPVIRRRH
jgi:hypothetical protein